MSNTEHDLQSPGEADPLATTAGARRSLSARQLEILSLISQGFSNKEIAKQIDLSLPTVKVELRKIMDNLRARDRTMAVAEAIRRGLIP